MSSYFQKIFFTDFISETEKRFTLTVFVHYQFTETERNMYEPCFWFGLNCCINNFVLLRCYKDLFEFPYRIFV